MAYKKSNPNGQATMANSEPVVIASDQSAVPVSGTVTANLSATDNAVLDQIELNQDAQTAILTTIDTDTGALVTSSAAIQTAVQLIDNAISGNEMQVDVVAPLPAGTNNIGDVDVLSLPALPTGANVIGALVANQSVNVAQMNGVATTMGNGTSGTGVQRVTIASDSTGQVAITGNALTALQLIDDTVLTDDAAATLGTTKGNAMAGVAVAMDGTDPLAVSAEGDASLLRSDPNRILLINQTHPRFFRASVDYASAQTNATVVAAPGAGLSLYITDIIVSNGATAGNITLLDGSGGSVVLELYPAINGGLTHSFRNPIKLTANTLLAITSQTVTTHSVTVTGYIAA